METAELEVAEGLRPCVRFPDYYIGRDAQVWSDRRRMFHAKGKLRKVSPQWDAQGKDYVNLVGPDGRKHKATVARLMREAFGVVPVLGRIDAGGKVRGAAGE